MESFPIYVLHFDVLGIFSGELWRGALGSLKSQRARSLWNCLLNLSFGRLSNLPFTETGSRDIHQVWMIMPILLSLYVSLSSYETCKVVNYGNKSCCPFVLYWNHERIFALYYLNALCKLCPRERLVPFLLVWPSRVRVLVDVLVEGLRSAFSITLLRRISFSNSI
ncbi:hypothetical protein KI387_035850, partial [Taxus chinensis]